MFVIGSSGTNREVMPPLWSPDGAQADTRRFMKVLILTQFVRDLPWEPSWWAVTLAQELHAQGHEVVVAMDGSENSDAFRPCRVLVRDPGRTHLFGRPQEFGVWARAVRRQFRDHRSISLTALADGDVRLAVEPDPAAVAARLWNEHPLISALLETVKHRSLWAEARVARRVNAGAALPTVPLGAELGYASALEPVSAEDRRGLNEELRGRLGVAAGAALGVMSAVEFEAETMGEFLRGVARAAGVRPMALVVLSRQPRTLHTLARQAGCADVLRLMGCTREPGRVLAACDFAVVPAEARECSTARWLADALRTGTPVVVHPRAAGVSRLHAPFANDPSPGVVAGGTDAASWASAIVGAIDGHADMRRSAAAVGESFAMPAFLGRVLRRLELHAPAEAGSVETRSVEAGTAQSSAEIDLGPSLPATRSM